MKIGIIGSGIAGLAAGRELANAGHEITVIERNRELGGRLGTTQAGESGEVAMDTGVSYLKATKPLFRGFLSELLNHELIRIWGDRVRLFDGVQLLNTPPPEDTGTRYIAPEGMGRIAKYLGRWSDFKSGERVGGLTYIGANRRTKRPWMMNLSSFHTFEADAVIIATPATEAYGVLLTAQDEVEIMTLIREIDEIQYDPALILAATYEADGDDLDWNGIQSEHKDVEWISNESSKRNLTGRNLVIRSTPKASLELRDASPEEIQDRLLAGASDILGDWVATPVWTGYRSWNYFRPRNVINRPYMELKSEDAPLAVVGDYFDGKGLEAAYCSGVKLAQEWNKRFREG